MNRRSFLGRIGAAVIGLTLARQLPGIAPMPPTLSPPTEYQMSADDIRERYIRPAARHLAEEYDRHLAAKFLNGSGGERVISRRGFLRALGLGAAALAIDSEIALWTPGQRTYFDLGTGRVGNQFGTVDWITREAFDLLTNQLRISRTFNRSYFEDFEEPMVAAPSIAVPLASRYAQHENGLWVAEDAA